MKIGLIGVGAVGGTLKKYFELNHPEHTIACVDPGKGMNDSLVGIDLAFIAVPVPNGPHGQDLTALRNGVYLARHFTKNIYIRSTVVPGTNDLLDTVSCPEFLTERQAYQDMCDLPILVGKEKENLLSKVFTKKIIYSVSNKEAELSKFAHNCFGAMKVTYFNIIKQMCDDLEIDYHNVRASSMMTGFIEPMHTQVPGPDGKYGYGGKCLPVNMDAMIEYCDVGEFMGSSVTEFFRNIRAINETFRAMPVSKHVVMDDLQC